MHRQLVDLPVRGQRSRPDEESRLTATSLVLTPLPSAQARIVKLIGLFSITRLQLSTGQRRSVVRHENQESVFVQPPLRHPLPESGDVVVDDGDGSVITGLLLGHPAIPKGFLVFVRGIPRFMGSQRCKVTEERLFTPLAGVHPLHRLLKKDIGVISLRLVPGLF